MADRNAFDDIFSSWRTGFSNVRAGHSFGAEREEEEPNPFDDIFSSWSKPKAPTPTVTAPTVTARPSFSNVLSGSSARPLTSDEKEREFQDWYADRAALLNLDPDPDSPLHHYDYRAAHAAGAEPTKESGWHWPSAFKALDHPNRYPGGGIYDSIYGKPRVLEGGLPTEAVSEKGEVTGNPFDDIFESARARTLPAAKIPRELYDWEKEERKTRGLPTEAMRGVKDPGVLGALDQAGGRTLRDIATAPVEFGSTTVGGLAGVGRFLGEATAAAEFEPEWVRKYGKTASDWYARQGRLQEKFRAEQLRPPEDELPGVSGKLRSFVRTGLAQAPQLGLVAATGPAALPILGLSSGGQEYQEAREKGVSIGKAAASGAISGAAEAFFERFGDVPIVKSMQGLGEHGMRAAIQRMGKEGLEEFATTIAQQAGKELSYDDQQKWQDTLKEAAYSGLVGLAMGAGGELGARPGHIAAAAEERAAQERRLGRLSGALVERETGMGSSRFAGLNALLAQEREAGRLPTFGAPTRQRIDEFGDLEPGNYGKRFTTEPGPEEFTPEELARRRAAEERRADPEGLFRLQRLIDEAKAAERGTLPPDASRPEDFGDRGLGRPGAAGAAFAEQPGLPRDGGLGLHEGPFPNARPPRAPIRTGFGDTVPLPGADTGGLVFRGEAGPGAPPRAAITSRLANRSYTDKESASIFGRLHGEHGELVKHDFSHIQRPFSWEARYTFDEAQAISPDVAARAAELAGWKSAADPIPGKAIRQAAVDEYFARNPEFDPKNNDHGFGAAQFAWNLFKAAGYDAEHYRPGDFDSFAVGDPGPELERTRPWAKAPTEVQWTLNDVSEAPAAGGPVGGVRGGGGFFNLRSIEDLEDDLLEAEKNAMSAVGGAKVAAWHKKAEHLRALIAERRAAEPVPTPAAAEAGINIDPGTPAAHAAAATPPRVFEVDRGDLDLDPATFQYKDYSQEATGTTGAMRDVAQWDPQLAGVLAVWRGPDGRLKVVNGHHRIGEIYDRTGATAPIAVMELQAPTAQAARAQGALINIAEGRGTAVDAAKFLRDSGLSGEDLKARGLSLSGGLLRQGIALSKLNPDIFRAVSSGTFSVEHGAILGERLPDDHAAQLSVAEIIAQQEDAGKRVSSEVVAELADMAKAAPQADPSQVDLFGRSTAKNLMLEKAQVAADITLQLGKEKRLFGTAAKGAEALTKGGNIIDQAKSAQVSLEAAQAGELFGKLKHAAPISGMLDEAARRIANGEARATVTRDTLAAIRPVLFDALRGGEGLGGAGAGAGPGVGPAAPGIDTPPELGLSGEPLPTKAELEAQGQGGLFSLGDYAQGVLGGATSAPSSAAGRTVAEGVQAAEGAAPTVGPTWYRLAFPEIVELAEKLNQGKLPQVRKRMRALGLFRSRKGMPGSAQVEIRADLFEDPAVVSLVLAHELGHNADFLDDANLARGGVLGRVASLHNYFKATLDALPRNPSEALTKKDRARLTKQARKETKGEGNDARKARYRELVEAEIKRRDLITESEVRDEMEGVSRIMRPESWDNASGKFLEYLKSPVELYADTFSLLINNPARLQQMAPKFWRSFHAYLDKKPTARQAFDDLFAVGAQGQEAIREHRSERTQAMFEEAQAAGIESKERREAAHKEARGNFFTRLMRSHWDQGVRAYWKARGRLGAVAPGAKEAWRSFTQQMERNAFDDSKRDFQRRLMEENVLQPAWNSGLTNAQVGEILFLRRAAGERATMANPLGIGGAYAEEQLAHLEEKYGKDTVKMVQDGWLRNFEEGRRPILEGLRDENVLSQQFIDHAIDNPDYVRFLVMRYLDRDASMGEALGLSGLKKQHGTLQKIADPVVATLTQDMILRSMLDRARGGRRLIEALRADGSERFQPAETVGRGRAERPVEPSDPRLGLIRFVQNGKIEGWWVPKDMADWFNHDAVEMSGAMEIMAKLNSVLRAAAVTHQPLFALWEIQRDRKNMATQIIRDVLPPVAGAKASYYMLKAHGKLQVAGYRAARARGLSRTKALLASPFVQAPTKEEMGMLQRGVIPPFERGHWGVQEPVGQSFERHAFRLLTGGTTDVAHAKSAAVRAMKAGWTYAAAVLRAPTTRQERAAKLAAELYFTRNKARLGLSQADIDQEIANVAGTPNQSRAGKSQATSNRLFVFSGVAKEGIRVAGETFRARPASVAAKRFYYSILPALFAAAAAKGLLDEALKRLMDRIPEDQKMRHNVIPVGETQDGKTIAIVTPQDHSGQLLHALTWKLATQHMSIKDLALVAAQSVPFMSGSLSPVIKSINQASQAYLGDEPPKDPFTGVPIMSAETMAKGGTEKVGAVLKAFARNFGLGAFVQAPKRNREESPQAWIERAMGIPGVGAVIGRYVRLYDYGTIETAREEYAAEKQKTDIAYEERRAAIKDILREDPQITDLEVRYKLADRGVYTGDPSRLGKTIDDLRVFALGGAEERAAEYRRRAGELKERREKWWEGVQ